VIGVEIARPIGLRTDREHRDVEALADGGFERALVGEGVATRLARIDEDEHAVGGVGERALGLELDVVAFGRVAIEQPRRIDQLIADMIAGEVADADSRRREGVRRDLVARVRDVVDEGGLADVRKARDHDRRFVGPDVGEVPEVVARFAEAVEVVGDLLDHVREPRKRLFPELACGLDVGVESALVFVFDLVGLPARPPDLGEALSYCVDVDEGVGELVVEGVDGVEIGPARHDVFQIVGEHVRRGLEHRLLGLDTGFRPTSARRQRERPIDQLRRGGRRRELFENHGRW